MNIKKINQEILKELLKEKTSVAIKGNDVYIKPNNYMVFKLDLHNEVFFNYKKSKLVQYLVYLFDTTYTDFDTLTYDCDVKYDKITMAKLCSIRKTVYVNAKYTKFFDNPTFKVALNEKFCPVYVYEGDRLVAIIMPINHKE